jgi:hypothetical protein
MKLRALVALSAIALAGCGDSTEPDASTLSFTYTGAGSASATNFSVSGIIPPNLSQMNSLGTTAWAAGGVEPTFNYSSIFGVSPVNSTTWDITGIGVTRKTVGTSPIDPNCDSEATDCTGVFLFLGFETDGDNFEWICGLTSGSVTITSISDTRMAGTFSGSGVCTDVNFVDTPFAITNGKFDVLLSSQLLLN